MEYADMQKIANKFANDNIKRGTVDKITDYSFRFITYPDKNGKVQETIYMLSWFSEI